MKQKTVPRPFPENRNYQMCILSTFAIIFVVLGHIRFGVVDMSETGTIYGWFPYYSFHLPVFLFISGYFFKDLPSKGLPSSNPVPAKRPETGCPQRAGLLRELGLFVLHKIKNLLLPYFVVTGLFLLFNSLLTAWGFTWPQPFTFENWLLAPWTKLYVLTFAVPAWYLIALFLAEMYFMLLRLSIYRILRKLLVKPRSQSLHASPGTSKSASPDASGSKLQAKDCLAEVIMLLLTLMLGILALIIHAQPGISETASVYLRSVLMLFFMQAGLLYRKHLEKKDTLQSVPYFLIVFAVQFLIILLSGNSRLSPGLYGLVGFEAFGYDYFLAGLTGIALYLRISRILASTARRSRLVLFISSSTKYIMEFHVFGFFLLNALFSVLSKGTFLETFLADFNNARWHSYLYYTMFENPRMIPFYLVAGMGISLIIAKIIQTVKKKF